MIRAVLFEIDGTLVDSNDLHVAAWLEVFDAAGHSIDEATLRTQMGKGGDNLVPAVLPGVGREAQKALTEAHGNVFRNAYIDRVEPFPAARALMKRVHDSGRQVVLATSAGRAELEHYVDLLDADDIVSATTSKDDVEVSKPAPDIFAAALSKAGVEADEAVAVGDTPYDIEAAGRAGIGTIAVLAGGFDRSVLEAAGADAIYADVRALLADYDNSPLAR